MKTNTPFVIPAHVIETGQEILTRVVAPLTLEGDCVFTRALLAEDELCLAGGGKDISLLDLCQKTPQ